MFTYKVVQKVKEKKRKKKDEGKLETTTNGRMPVCIIRSIPCVSRMSTILSVKGMEIELVSVWYEIKSGLNNLLLTCLRRNPYR